MPRPPDVTDEMIAEWIALCEKHIPPGDPRRDVFCSGEWLSIKLREAGADEQTNNDVVFAAGQRMCAATWSQGLDADFWQVAQDALDRYVRGEADEPGPALAIRLCEDEMCAQNAPRP